MQNRQNIRRNKRTTKTNIVTIILESPASLTRPGWRQHDLKAYQHRMNPRKPDVFDENYFVKTGGFIS